MDDQLKEDVKIPVNVLAAQVLKENTENASRDDQQPQHAMNEVPVKSENCLKKIKLSSLKGFQFDASTKGPNLLHQKRLKQQSSFNVKVQKVSDSEVNKLKLENKKLTGQNHLLRTQVAQALEVSKKLLSRNKELVKRISIMTAERQKFKQQLQEVQKQLSVSTSSNGNVIANVDAAKEIRNPNAEEGNQNAVEQPSVPSEAQATEAQAAQAQAAESQAAQAQAAQAQAAESQAAQAQAAESQAAQAQAAQAQAAELKPVRNPLKRKHCQPKRLEEETELLGSIAKKTVKYMLELDDKQGALKILIWAWNRVVLQTTGENLPETSSTLRRADNEVPKCTSAFETWVTAALVVAQQTYPYMPVKAIFRVATNRCIGQNQWQRIRNSVFLD